MGWEGRGGVRAKGTSPIKSRIFYALPYFDYVKICHEYVCSAKKYRPPPSSPETYELISLYKENTNL